jgi:hypothetical protein
VSNKSEAIDGICQNNKKEVPLKPIEIQRDLIVS